jgi:hypothetical protein
MRNQMSQSLDNQTTIKGLARRIAAINPRDHTGVVLLGLMAGVLYSLNRAAELDFDDARMKRSIGEEKIEIQQTLGSIEHSHVPANPWLAGFYLGRVNTNA